MKHLHLIFSLFVLQTALAQQEVTVTMAYPDDEGYFVYSIPPTDEHARFGGMYYFKVENTGTVDLIDWEMTTLWKALNSTWGVVEKTVLDPTTGLIRLTGPTWDGDLSVGESFILSGEWVPTSSIEDWITFLPREIEMSTDAGSVSIIYDTEGEVTATGFMGQKVQPIDPDRKTFTDLKTVAYFPLFDAENAWCSLQKYGHNIDQLRVQLYSITPEGELRAGQDLPDGVDPVVDIHYWYDFIDDMGVVDYCLANDIELIPVAFNYNPEIGDFDQMAVHTMMTTPDLRADHLADIITVLNAKPAYAGIDIDYESLMAEDRENYAAFMEDLADALHAEDKILTTAVHTKVGPGTWYGPQAQDFERIGNAVDEILFMTYDLHWATSPTFADPPPTAGCQGTPDWMNDVACFGISEIDDPSKIQLGLPFYGYRWKYLFEEHTLDDPGVGLTYQDAQDLIELYDIAPEAINRETNGNEPYFNVTIDGVEWTCYYQDEIALEYKLSALDEYDLRDYIGGVGIWRLGGESDAMWDAVSTAMGNGDAVIDESFDCSEPTDDDDDDGGSDDHSGITEEIKSGLVIFPNPTKDQLTVHHPTETIVGYTIYDLTGKVVSTLQATDNFIDVSGLEDGTYILRLQTDNHIFLFRPFVKQ